MLNVSGGISDSRGIGAAQEELLKEWDAVPNVLTTSSRKGDGRRELLAYIAQLRDLFTGAAKPAPRKTSEIIGTAE